ncbi:MAG TPA: hypothetical protein PLO62_07600 [Candidatus Hydrogenedentes bacterium]|nr:hypothetical protein [Candidatus Hydrogenedentota bacterium]HOS03166.1 hypothetical protein [Candidatus Hydrogenedentota bacterium]
MIQCLGLHGVDIMQGCGRNHVKSAKNNNGSEKNKKPFHTHASKLHYAMPTRNVGCFWNKNQEKEAMQGVGSEKIPGDLEITAVAWHVSTMAVSLALPPGATHGLSQQ